MTVQELIKELKKYNPDANVHISSNGLNNRLVRVEEETIELECDACEHTYDYAFILLSGKE